MSATPALDPQPAAAECPEPEVPRTHAPPETWVPVSRGLRQHLPKLSGNAVKLYLHLLLSARFSGPYKGQVAASFADLALELGIHWQSVRKAAEELRPTHIVWEPARNQHGTTVFTVQDYKTTADFALSRALSPTTQSNVGARYQQGRSNSSNAMEGGQLRRPKNGDNVNKKERDAIASELMVGLGPQLTTGRVKPEALERARKRVEAEHQADLARLRAEKKNKWYAPSF